MRPLHVMSLKTIKTAQILLFFNGTHTNLRLIWLFKLWKKKRKEKNERLTFLSQGRAEVDVEDRGRMAEHAAP